MAGLPLTGYMNFLSQLYEVLPVITGGPDLRPGGAAWDYAPGRGHGQGRRSRPGPGEDFPQRRPPRLQAHGLRQDRFEQTKRDKEAKKNQRIVEIKEVRMSPGIDVNDSMSRSATPSAFCPTQPGEGHRRFRGREMAHTDIGKRLLEKFAEDCTEVATMDKEPKLDGRHMTMFLSCRQNKDAKKETKNKF